MLVYRSIRVSQPGVSQPDKWSLKREEKGMVRIYKKSEDIMVCTHCGEFLLYDKETDVVVRQLPDYLIKVPSIICPNCRRVVGITALLKK